MQTQSIEVMDRNGKAEFRAMEFGMAEQGEKLFERASDGEVCLSTEQPVPRQRNQRIGNCDKCRAFVEAGTGYLFKMRGCNAVSGDYSQRVRGIWHVRCEACTRKTPSVRREMGLTGEQPVALRTARERKRQLQTETEALIATFSGGTGCVPRERMDEYRLALAELRARYAR